MRRKLALIAVLGGLATGFGCQHIGGKHDCGYNPADYQLPEITSPYTLYPVKQMPGKTLPDVKDKGGSDTAPKSGQEEG
ncbi:MAG: hypothetical protein U0792_08420 [Gemmataceae bacterium]